MNVQKTGKLCKRGLEVRPYHSGAGWYLGTYDEEGPRCRVSEKYARTEVEAWKLRPDRIACQQLGH